MEGKKIGKPGNSRKMSHNAAAYYHLPGLFEFYRLYRVFLPLFFEHREYFYDWCRIGSMSPIPAV